MERFLVWLPLALAVIAGATGYLDTKATADNNKEKIEKLESKSEKWTDERRVQREAQIRYEVRQEQMKAQQEKTIHQLDEIKRLIQQLNRQ